MPPQAWFARQSGLIAALLFLASGAHPGLWLSATTGELVWGKPDAALSAPGSVAPATLGKDSWKWLYIQPMTAR